MTAVPEFRHDRPGTPAEEWTAALAARPTSVLRLPATHHRLVLVGAHPDDETLGAGGLLRAAARAGWQVEVVSATAGEGSHPASPTHSASQLAQVRRGELEAAVRVLAPEATVSCLDLPDGDVASHVDEVVAHLVETIGDGEDVLLCAPWRHDGHPDHEAMGRAAAVAARRTDALLLEYPVWLWHWGRDADLPRTGTSTLPLDQAARAAKGAGIDRHASQVRPLSTETGDEALLGPELLAHFARDSELYISTDEPVEDDALDQVHRDRPDPWHVDSPYERRKRALTLASLPREHYAAALEVGCSVGALAVDLARRCDHLLALDASPTAVELARRRTSAIDHLDVRRSLVPDDWPAGTFDLVSISEVGYFLSPRQLADVVERALTALTDDGHLLLCHWRHQPVGWPLAGPAVHDAFLATGASVLVEHQEPDFLLHVLARPR